MADQNERMMVQLLSDAVTFSGASPEVEKEAGLGGGVGLYATGFYNGLLLAAAEPEIGQAVAALLGAGMVHVAEGDEVARVTRKQQEWLDSWRATRG